ncbi:GCN5 family acetyltransferase [Croceicoccus estronivorus]|uniref:GNAT family N-acetyltransferase n=1 Tax=Croceicoccus estronivorus TaxID=1172626 RepID=UPI00082BA079|nr:N-acetyltransferase [Croceicoccus estronivorus]OCC23862.1 GCN5 family acetyltransferase [Croceicoccus estronivorus]
MTAIATRLEAPGDEAAIEALTHAAFHSSPQSDGSEAEIIHRLRQDGDLVLSFVAENMDQAIVGHIAFSPVTISDGTRGWFGLAPVSVIPLRQRAGIGSTLIEKGLAHLKRIGAGGCVVLGDPDYYGRFGFTHDPGLNYPGPPAKFFQRIVFKDPAPHGIVRYAKAFD